MAKGQQYNPNESLKNYSVTLLLHATVLESAPSGNASGETQIIWSRKRKSESTGDPRLLGSGCNRSQLTPRSLSSHAQASNQEGHVVAGFCMTLGTIA
jgi:hypothetical protein